MISSLLAAGVFVAIPITGRVLLGPLRVPIPAIAQPSLWISAGLAVWSVPLLGSLILGAYRPEVIGAAGWLAVVGLVAARKVRWPHIPRLSVADRVVIAAVVMAGMLAAAYPADPFTVGRDNGTYASHAVYMAHHGRLDVPYPWAAGPIPSGLLGWAGIDQTEPTLTVQFGHLFPAWLAQTFAFAGTDGLVRLNVVIGAFALLAIYGLMKRFVAGRVAALLMILLAFNPATIWIARQTLTEPLAQLLIWSGLLLLTAHLSVSHRWWATWAGILLGLSALVRIDSFLLVPFVLAGHASWIVLRRHRPIASPLPWAGFYLGAVPSFSAALAYYVIFSRPYLDHHSTQMLEIGALTILAALALALAAFPPTVRLARAALGRRAVVIGLVGTLFGLTAYAYFLRPILPPFVTFHAPGALFDGARSHVEDALPNLGRYLTPAVVWGATFGASAVFLAAIRSPRRAFVLPLLVVVVGSTAVYAWSQSVFPDHYWAIRRFVPVIIPGLVLLAGVGASVALSRLSRPGRRLAIALSAVFALVFTLYIGAPTYAVSERQGSYEALGDFASSVSGSHEIIAVDGFYESANFWMPLLLAFDQPVVPLNVANEDGRATALARLRAASPEEPVTIVTAAHDYRMDAVVGPRTVQTKWSRTLIDLPIIPLPRGTNVENITLTAIEATGINTVGVAFGGRPQWVAGSSGLYRAELVDGRPLRWTDGNGQISIPIEGGSPRRLAISIADTGPDGGSLRIALNGTTLFEGAVSAGPWSAEYQLAGVADLHPGDTAEIEIASDTFMREAQDGGEAEGPFGVQLDTITLFD